MKHTERQCQKFRSYGGAARVTVEIRQMPPDAAKIRKPINRAQQMILRIMIIKRDLREQTRLRFLPRTHHYA